MKNYLFYSLICIFLIACTDSNSNKTKNTSNANTDTKLFSKVSAQQSGLNFQNVVREDMKYNFLNFPYLYAGAGVAVGDIDNDGLVDVFMTSNFGSNKLFKNKGDLTFDDISVASKTGDVNGFTTGALMMDINNDGWLDIYVSKSGVLEDEITRRNKLFINQKDGSFTEEAKKWGVDDPGYTTQAYQLDYDKDGDLDLYVVNYRTDFKNNTKISSKIQSEISEFTSDQLYRNDGTKFTKVTGEAGLYNKAWGLAGTVGDFNNDTWPDIYVSNDFLEPDVMYINQKDGTFKNEINTRISHISFNSMGADYADLNNDLYSDLITVDMLAENYARSKENMASMSTQNFTNMVKVGYHHAYMANMLHLNTGNGNFKETAQLSGVVKTDWSWSPLIADFDNDGLKDIFISNGVLKDYTNQDFRVALREKNNNGESMTLEAVLAMLPAEKLDNYLYKNNGDLSFTKSTTEWGLNDPSFSNGAAYADLDNDGDLDLIVNNVNDPVSLYENNAAKNYIQVQLKGPSNNALGLGAEVFVISNQKKQYQQLYLARGFQSSVSNVLHFGLDDEVAVNQLMIQWPDGKVSILEQPAANKKHTISYASATNTQLSLRRNNNKRQIKDPTQLGINYRHQENEVNDYALQLLLPHKQSSKGTGIAVADVNGDGLEDFFVGNAAGAVAQLNIQSTKGVFKTTNTALWNREAAHEDAGALFFDADGDGDQDLYVISAGYELKENNPLLQDRLYMNDGKGNFSRNNSALPVMLSSGKSVAAGDYDGDGDTDLFVGGNVIPGKYPLAPRSFLLKNDNGTFTNATAQNEVLSQSGMISEAIFTDFDMDNDLDLFVVGEWMNPTIFTNNNGSFEKTEIPALKDNEGWWYSITAADFDQDGDPDYVLGNIGLNNKFQPKKDKPIYIYSKDFDNNGSYDVALTKMNNGKLVPVRGKECSSEQNPFLLDKIGTFKEFASLEFKDIYGEDRLKDANKLVAHNFASIYMQNNGDGTFTISKLSNQAQLGPTLASIAKDINGDGKLDIMGIGGMYDAEVETIRYDSNHGYVLLGDGHGNFVYDRDFDLNLVSDAKDMTAINLNGNTNFIVVSNNSPLQIFSFQP